MSKKVQKKCGTCKWLQPREQGKRLHHSNSYPCRYQFPPIDWPASMPDTAYNSPQRDLARPIRGYMRPGDGTDCPCWEIPF